MLEPKGPPVRGESVCVSQTLQLARALRQPNKQAQQLKLMAHHEVSREKAEMLVKLASEKRH